MHLEKHFCYDDERLQRILAAVADSYFPLGWQSAAIVVQRDGVTVPVALAIGEAATCDRPSCPETSR